MTDRVLDNEIEGFAT